MSSGYTSSQPTRPGILTAVGVISIVIASLSLLVDFGSLMFASGVSRFATGPNQTPIAAPAPPSPATAHAEYVGAQGLSAAQRQIVINGLSQLRALSEARQKQLDGLLADVGQQVIHLSAENLTPERIANYATGVQEIPNGSGGPPDDMFILGSGRLQLSDQSAVFFPENSPSPIRSGGGSYTDSSGSHLATEQIAAVEERVQSLCNRAMNDAQLKSLEGELEAASQTLITPSPSVTQAAAQVLTAQSLGDGTIAVTTKSNSMSFGPTGQSFAGVMPMGAAGGPWGGPRTTVTHRDATLLMLDSLLSFLAAGLLLASGIMVMRSAPQSRWMLLIYAIGKMMLVALSCYAIYSIARELNASSLDSQSTAMAWMLIVGGPGIIFPVILLIVMNLKSVREFLYAPTVARIF
jgi:hypothetical protein